MSEIPHSFKKTTQSVLQKRACPAVILSGNPILLLGLRQYQIQNYSNQRRKAYSRHADASNAKYCPPDACCQDKRNDNQVAGIAHICFILYHVVYPSGGYHTEKEKHDSSKHGPGYGLQKCTYFTHQREKNPGYCGDTDHHRIGHLCQYHSSCNLRIGCNRWSPY